MLGRKRVRIFAGPNGSGKSTLKGLIESLVNVGVYVNADEITESLKNDLRIDFSEYGLNVAESHFEEEYSQWTIPTKRKWWIFKDNGITVTNQEMVEDYFAAFLADYVRNSLLGTVDVFSFETVMSHPSKLEFITKAKQAGYKVYLYFISLPDPNLNVLRIETRVKSGGHNVESTKVRSRYYRTMDSLYEAIRLVDSAYLFDNSQTKPQFFARKENGLLAVVGDGEYVPMWYKTYVLDKRKD